VHLSLIARARRFTYVNASLGEQGAAKGVAAVRENAPRETIIPFLRRARVAHRATLYLLSARVRLITSSEFNGVHKSPVQCWEALKTAISARMSRTRNVTPHISIRATQYPQLSVAWKKKKKWSLYLSSRKPARFDLHLRRDTIGEGLSFDVASVSNRNARTAFINVRFRQQLFSPNFNFKTKGDWTRRTKTRLAQFRIKIEVKGWRREGKIIHK